MQQQGNACQIPIKRDRPDKEIAIIMMKGNKSSWRKRNEKNE